MRCRVSLICRGGGRAPYVRRASCICNQPSRSRLFLLSRASSYHVYQVQTPAFCANIGKERSNQMSQEAKDSSDSNIGNKSTASKEETTPKQPSTKETSKSQKHPKIANPVLLKSDGTLDCHQKLEKKKQQILIGQLKAAESHKRIQDMRFRYKTMRAEEINLLISSQPTARKAIRLEALLPPYEEQINLKDTLNKLQRKRVEEIISDEAGLTINRNL